MQAAESVNETGALLFAPAPLVLPRRVHEVILRVECVVSLRGWRVVLSIRLSPVGTSHRRPANLGVQGLWLLETLLNSRRFRCSSDTLTRFGIWYLKPGVSFATAAFASMKVVLIS